MTRGLRGLVGTIEGYVPDEVGDRLTGSLSKAVGRTETPPHVDAPDSVTVTRFFSDIEVSRYVSGVDADPTATYSLAADDPYEAVDVPLTGLRSVAAVTVEAEFETTGGGTDSDRFVYTADDAFDPSDRMEVSLSASTAATGVTITVEAEPATGSTGLADTLSDLRVSMLEEVTGRGFERSDVLRVGVPALRRRTASPPIFLISIDALRWDRQAALDPLIEALGGPDVVVDEPRTQGHWTPPSHACMFTGLHPGDHRYVGLDHGADEPIHEDATTLGDVLHGQGYKTRGLVSHTRILPEVGFGHGFFQYRLANMSNWLTRAHDARAKVDTLVDWVDRDLRTGPGHGLFYFMHVFDPHMPYVPPDPTAGGEDIDLAAVEEYRSSINDVGVGPDYLELLGTDHDIDPAVVDRVRSYYEASVGYTAEQVARLFEHLRDVGVFQDALVVVTGDHGEEFGERGTFTHNSLYDANIRQFMAVKPPADGDWETPTAANTIDIVPTVARAVGAPDPDPCQGRAWQDDGSDREPRVTERIRPDWYNVAVERDGVKGIFTYEDDYPDLPTEAALASGPVRREFYRIADVRDGDYAEADPDPEVAEALESTAAEFAGRTPVVQAGGSRAVEISQDTEDRLEQLGYK